MKFHVTTRAAADVGFVDAADAGAWAEQIVEQLDETADYRKFMEENQQGLGKKKGNTGHGYLEAVIPAKLWKVLETRDPDLLQDDKKWEALKATFPDMFIKPRKVFF